MPRTIREIAADNANSIVQRGLHAFTNVDVVCDLICERHAVTANQRHFAKLQAESIKSCLLQGLEYRHSALDAEHSRPTLIYYSIMSFALCEILFKRDGNFRLEKLRENHAHHGLDFALDATRKYHRILPSDLAVKLLNRGTFRVWYETLSKRGSYGELTTIESDRARSHRTQILSAPDPNSNRYSKSTLNLLELLEICPALYQEASGLNIVPRLARSTFRVTRNLMSKQVEWSIFIHPGPREVIDSVISQIVFHPRCVDLVDIIEFESGAGISFACSEDADYLIFQAPSSFCHTKEQVLLIDNDFSLNEFGVYYLIMYIAGMFARYYPEHWARCIEHRNSLYLALNAAMEGAAHRVPILLLEELRDEFYLLV